MYFEGNVRCRSNVEDLEYMKNSLNPNGKGQIKMLSDFLPGQEGREVPDAYYARGIWNGKDFNL